ncbi:hypothetical protein AB0D13_37465 [Streptomyces sp. NPDC048430]|uniref:hypothetical protein n=1 Tax=Streptomyces sp. NPDC048430 TaxID=3155388 RepID=UPI00343589EF
MDLLIGTNAEEGSLHLAPFGALGTLTTADMEATAALFRPDPARYVASFRRSRPGATGGERRSALIAEALFAAGSRDLVAAHATHSGPRTADRMLLRSVVQRSSTQAGRTTVPHQARPPCCLPCQPTGGRPGQTLGERQSRGEDGLK